MTRAELVGRSGTGLSEYHLWEIENGLAPADSADLGLFAEALQVHPGWFFDTTPLSKGIELAQTRTALQQVAERFDDLSKLA